jgi:hypothetical protein
MRTKPSASQRIRTLIDSDHTNKAIIEKLQCKPQAVYTIRYQINKARGLGSIGTLPKPTGGIGAPPKRKYTRKIKAGKLASLPKVGDNVGGLVLTDMGNGNLRWVAPPPLLAPEMQITMIEPPTLWQRIKGWFRG